MKPRAIALLLYAKVIWIAVQMSHINTGDVRYEAFI